MWYSIGLVMGLCLLAYPTLQLLFRCRAMRSRSIIPCRMVLSLRCSSNTRDLFCRSIYSCLVLFRRISSATIAASWFSFIFFMSLFSSCSSRKFLVASRISCFRTRYWSCDLKNPLPPS